ncbi:MAG: hypothetical protein OEX12_02015 [Gammaproteobacteria bacterium]|nr:hypothetical protein [Gammaproteobacteria bacterium]
MSDKDVSVMSVIGFGIVSAVLYTLLYIYSGDLEKASQLVQQGEKIYFLIPIAIAFVFSYFHGTFTDRFWSMLGLKAKK